MYIQLFLFLFVVTTLSALEPIAPLPTNMDHIDLEKAKLGRSLFFDPQLSSDKTISCHSCHSFDNGGADPRVVSIGVQGREGSIQSPTVYNAVYNFKQFWNGRADNLIEQAKGPLSDHAEMNMSPKELETRLNNSSYKETFHKVYHISTIKYEHIIDAISEFEKALVTPNSRFDQYLRGEIVLTPAEKKGYATFKSLGCITCHNGINVGANSFQKIGLFRPYPYNPDYKDRYDLTNKEYHKNVFKVPTLRNVSLNAPYFHDARAKTLNEAIVKMAYHNLGIDITKEEVQSIIVFLKSLEGERPKILDIE